MVFKNLIFILVTFLVVQACSSTKVDNPNISSLKKFDFKDLDSLIAIQPKPIAIFIHTDWCKYCRNMEQTSFKNPNVIQILNEDFYFISFDGESKDEVMFNNQTYKYQPNGRSSGIHELAIELGMVNGEISYPTFVILDTQKDIVFQHSAFLSGENMLKMLGRFL